MGLQERLPLLEERIQNDPSNVDLYLRRALVLSDLGEFKRAFSDLDTAAQLGSPKQTYFVRGMLFYRLGQFDTAVSFFSQFLEQYPDNTGALLYRGRVLRDAGKHQSSLDDHLRYIAVNPNAEPGVYLAITQLMTGLIEQGSSQYDYDQLLAILDQRVAQLGAAPQLQGYAIEVVKSICQADQAIQRLNQLPDQSQRAPQWHLQLAEQNLLLNNATQAQQHLNDANANLQQKRPTAFRAEQMHRYRFLKQLLDAPPASSAIFAQAYYAFYPSQTKHTEGGQHSDGHNHDDDHTHTYIHNHENDHGDHHHHHDDHEESTHTHDPLDDFQQPNKADPNYQNTWAEPVEPFRRCALQRLEATANP